MTRLGSIICWIIAVSSFILFLDIFPLLPLFGAAVGLFFYFKESRSIQKTYGCSIGEFLLVTDSDLSEALRYVDREYCVKRLTLGFLLFCVGDYATRWVGLAVVEILNVFFPNVFINKEFVDPEEFSRLQKRL